MTASFAFLRFAPSSPLPRAGILAAATAVAMALSGCASGTDPALQDARAAVQAARTDPEVREHAPLPLQEAEEALARAERASEGDDAEREEVEHLAYLTRQRVAIARASATEAQHQAEIAALGDRRGDIVLQARNQEILELQRQLRELQAERTERGLVVTLGDVLFEVDRANLTPGAQVELQRLAAFLEEQPDRRVLIEGHTDNTGSADYNLQLSRLRAEAVRDFLVLNGVAPDRIRAEGYGETRPEAPNDTAAGRQQNRRVEIVILDEGTPFPVAAFGG